MYWQYIVGGSNGLIGYSFDWMRRKESADEFARQWAVLCKVAGEISNFIPVILSVEAVPPIDVSSKDVVCRAWSKDGVLYVAACNITSTMCEATITFKSGKWRLDGNAVFGRAEMFDAGALNLSLPVNGVSLLCLRPAENFKKTTMED